MKHKIFSFTMLAAALAGLTACSQKDEFASSDGTQPVRLTASTTTITRAADGIYTEASGFTGGEEAEVYMNGTETHATYDIAAPSGGSSDLTVSSGQTALDYPAESGTVTLFAVYPATSTASHVVKRDQSGDVAYRQSDLMYASTTVADAERGNLQNLVFEHKLVKLKMQITKPADVSVLGNVTLLGVKRKVTVTPSASGIAIGTAVATESGDDGYDSDADVNNSITVAGGEESNASAQTYTYACVLPENVWAADDAFLSVELDGQLVTYKVDAAQTLAQGKEYVLTLNASKNAVGGDQTTASLSAWGSITEATVGAPTDANALTVEVSGANPEWDGTAKTPTVTVKNKDGGTLTEGTDYDLSYYDNTAAGDKAVVLATGKGTYAGKAGYTFFTIAKKTDGEISYAITALTKNKGEGNFTNSLTNTGDGAVTYSSSDTDVATVNATTGEVSIVDGGTAVITATVTNTDNCTYTTATATYTLTVNTPIDPSSITAEDITNYRGTSANPRAWVICEDGDLHLCQNGTEVNPSSSVDSPVYLSSSGTLSCGKKKVAVVCYVGSAGTVDLSTGASGFRGLAIAIEDANGGSTCKWYTDNSGTCVAQNSNIATVLNTAQDDSQWWTGIDNTNKLGNHTGTCAGHTHAAAHAVLNYSSTLAGTGFSHAVPTGMSQWFMPTMAQWNLIVKGLTGGSADLTISNNSNYNTPAVNKYIATAAGGTGVQADRYWSSVEYGTSVAWRLYFSFGNADGYNKSLNCKVRPVLAF